MKMVMAILRPDKFEETKQALQNLGISGMTVSEVQGHGRQKGHTEVYRGSEHQVDLLPKIKLETVVTDDSVDQVVDVICSVAQTEKIGDGKIFVWTIDEAIRVSTGEQGEVAV